MANRFTNFVSGLFSRLIKDKAGNVAMTFGLSMMPLLFAVGAAVDLTKASAVQQKLAGTADAVALAAARSYKDVNGRNAVGDRFLNANMSEYGGGVTITDIDVDFDDEAEIVTVSLDADVPNALMSIAGIDKQSISIVSKVSYEGHVSQPVSLAMVLDVSGSMSWYGKINTLRTAATRLLDNLDEADPDADYVRTGIVTYYSRIRQTVNMDWGIDHTRSLVQGLWASGGTRSTSAVNRAGGWLTSNVEDDAHDGQSIHEGEEFELQKFMIFMTDGDNNYQLGR